MSDRKDTGGTKMQSGWAGPGIEIWPEEDDYIMWRSMKNERGCKTTSRVQYPKNGCKPLLR